MITTILLVSAGLTAIIAASVTVGMWLSKAIDEVFGHEEPPARKDEHEDVEEVWG